MDSMHIFKNKRHLLHQINSLRKNFTSEDEKIDKFIQRTQLNINNHNNIVFESLKMPRISNVLCSVIFSSFIFLF